MEKVCNKGKKGDFAELLSSGKVFVLDPLLVSDKKSNSPEKEEENKIWSFIIMEKFGIELSEKIGNN